MDYKAVSQQVVDNVGWRSIEAQAPAPADNTENPSDMQDTSDWRRARRHMTATTGQASGGDTPFAQP